MDSENGQKLQAESREEAGSSGSAHKLMIDCVVMNKGQGTT
jgi:hypothetical protein